MRQCQDWLRFAVAGVSWEDAQAYYAWLAATAVPGARLCTDREWERAARGADGRLYPHADVFHPGDENVDATYGVDDDQMGVDEVGSYPLDESPFGAFDLSGNLYEWAGGDASTHVAHGGSWHTDPMHGRVAFHYVSLAALATA